MFRSSELGFFFLKKEQKMESSKNWGIKFGEHMGGYFCEGAANPKDGFARGKTEGHPVDFWVKIRIESIREFFDNPELAAEMTGICSAGPLGKKLPLEKGQFNIYPGEEGAGLKHISYKFGLTSAAGEPHFFSGIKNIHINRKERVKKENVTLFSRIYKGDSEDGELIGSGILLFHILKDGPGMFSSLRVTGARSFGEKMRALRMFAAM